MSETILPLQHAKFFVVGSKIAVIIALTLALRKLSLQFRVECNPWSYREVRPLERFRCKVPPENYSGLGRRFEVNEA